MNEQNVLVAGDIANDKTDMDSTLKELTQGRKGRERRQLLRGQHYDADVHFQGNGVGVPSWLCSIPFSSTLETDENAGESERGAQ